MGSPCAFSVALASPAGWILGSPGREMCEPRISTSRQRTSCSPEGYRIVVQVPEESVTLLVAFVAFYSAAVHGRRPLGSYVLLACELAVVLQVARELILSVIPRPRDAAR